MQINFNSGVYNNFRANNSARTNVNFKGVSSKFYNSLSEIADDIIRQEGTRKLLSETSDGKFIAIGRVGGKKATSEEQANAMNAIVVKIINSIEQRNSSIYKLFQDDKLLKLAIQYAPKTVDDNSRKYANELIRLMKHCGVPDNVQTEIETILAQKGMLDGLQGAKNGFDVSSYNYLFQPGNKEYITVKTGGRSLGGVKDDHH